MRQKIRLAPGAPASCVQATRQNSCPLDRIGMPTGGQVAEVAGWFASGGFVDALPAAIQLSNRLGYPPQRSQHPQQRLVGLQAAAQLLLHPETATAFPARHLCAGVLPCCLPCTHRRAQRRRARRVGGDGAPPRATNEPRPGGCLRAAVGRRKLELRRKVTHSLKRLSAVEEAEHRAHTASPVTTSFGYDCRCAPLSAQAPRLCNSSAGGAGASAGQPALARTRAGRQRW